MAGITQVGILALQPQDPVNVPVPPVESYYMFVNIFDGITYYKDSNRVCHPINGIPQLPNNQIFIGNQYNVATPVTVQGDLVSQNNGNFTVIGIRDIPVAPGNYSVGTMLYYDGVVWQKLIPGTNGQQLTMVGGIPTWV